MESECPYETLRMRSMNVNLCKLRLIEDTFPVGISNMKQATDKFSVLSICLRYALRCISRIPYLTLSTLGKNFSRRHIEIFVCLFVFPQKIGFEIPVNWGDNLHEKSNPVFLGKIRKQYHQFDVC